MRITTVDYPKSLFRYTQALFAKQMIDDGIVSLASADLYRQAELLEAQRDNERARNYTPDTARLRVVPIKNDKPGEPLKGISDFRMTFEMPNYHILCLAEGVTPQMATAFPNQLCVEIHNPVEFFDRLDKAIARQIPEYRFYTGPVNYVSQHVFPPRLNNLELIYTKFDQFSYQMEYRIVLFTDLTTPPAPRYLFKLGCLSDICRIIEPPFKRKDQAL